MRYYRKVWPYLRPYGRLAIVSVVLLDMVMTLLFWGSESGFRISG